MLTDGFAKQSRCQVYGRIHKKIRYTNVTFEQIRKIQVTFKPTTESTQPVLCDP